MTSLSMLETYQKNAGPALRNELAITTADMRTGNYEAALTRLEAKGIKCYAFRCGKGD